MEIRPRPEQCQQWIKTASFELIKPFIDFLPYHYGNLGQRACPRFHTQQPWRIKSFMPNSDSLPILAHKDYLSLSVFTPENLLREARRQKSIAEGSIPRICILVVIFWTRFTVRISSSLILLEYTMKLLVKPLC